MSNLILITNTNETEKDPLLSGNGRVWKTKYDYAPIAIQNTVLVMEDKNSSYAVRVKSRHDINSKLPAFHKIQKHYAHDFQLIETGCNSVTKCAFVVDIDQPYTHERLKQKLDTINDLPPCILTYRIETGHWQVQFYLNTNVAMKYIIWNKGETEEISVIKDGKVIKKTINKEPEIINYNDNNSIYKTALKKLSKKLSDAGILKVDPNYHGGMMRNIYHKGQRTFIYENKQILKLDDYVPYISEDTLENFISDVVITKQEAQKIKLESDITDNTLIENSRHFLTLEFGRRYMFRELGQKHEVTRAGLQDYLLSIKFEIANICQKEPHSDKEIMSQVDSIYDWCMKEYDATFKPIGIQTTATKNWNKAQHQAKIKRAKELKAAFIARKLEGYRMEDIARYFHMSRGTLYTYLPLFMIVDTVATHMRKYKTYIKNDWSYITNIIDKRIKHCKGLDYQDIRNYLHTIKDSEYLIQYHELEPDSNQIQLEERYSYKIAA